MDWTQVIAIVLGSTVLSTVISGFFNKPKTNAETQKIHSEIDEKYSDRLERRIDVITEKLELYEMREMIEQSAINCAHKCHIPDEECPVLQYMGSHPLPHKGQFVKQHMEEVML